MVGSFGDERKQIGAVGVQGTGSEAAVFFCSPPPLVVVVVVVVVL